MRDDILPARTNSQEQTAIPPASRNTSSQTPLRTHLTGAIRSKIILLYLFLTIIGTIIGTQLIVGPINEHFVDQSLAAAQIVEQGFSRREEENVQSLRLMTTTESVAQAMHDDDAVTLQNLLTPIAATSQTDSVIAVSSEGRELLGLHAILNSDGSIDYQTSQGQDLSTLPMVAPVLAGRINEIGDAYVGLVNTPAGMTLYSAGPVLINDELVGTILVGSNLERLLEQLNLQLDSPANFTFYDAEGLSLASTFPGWSNPLEREILAIDPAFLEATLQQAADDQALVNFKLNSRRFHATFVPLVIRQDTIGMLGVALPSNLFFLFAQFISAQSFVVLFASSALLVAVALVVSRLILQRMLRLMNVARVINEGTQVQDTSISPGSELEILSRSFDTLIDHLEERTQALQQEIAKITAILSSIADGVVVRDVDGHVTLMNDAALTMLSDSSGLIDSHLADLTSTPADSPIMSSDGKLIEANETHRLELSDRILSARTAPVRTSTGRAIGTVLVMRDVTREAAAEHLRDDFVNSVSHELRTPLTIIKGYADLLKPGKDKVQAATYKKAMDAIFQHSRSLERMISQLIDLSEMAAGTLVLKTEPTNLNSLLEQILRDWDAHFSECGLELQLNQYTENLICEADQRRLAWALESIIRNACQYSPDGGRFDVTLSRLESAAVLQFKDHGIGISGEDLPHVFKRFYRGMAYDAEGILLDKRGLGQGLYVVKSIIERHGGRVWVDSNIGEGSQFSILLPLMQDNTK